MKWSKFQAFAAEHLELGHALDWHLGPGLRPSHRREFVERYVKYVAPRPWENLDFEAKSYPLDEYWAHYCIVNDEERVVKRKSALDNGVGASVAELLESLKQWRGEYWAKQENCTMAVVAIIRHRNVWKNEGEFTHETLDVYFPPEGFAA